MAKELKFVLLLDCYGELLTVHQRNIMELYYCEDLSLSEIGAPLGITRQAVCTLIKRTETILLNYEEKLGFAEKIGKMRDCFEKISSAADSLEDESVRSSIKSEIKKGLSIL
ncbi:MAG: YlxM family DNA-binding protein [Ruminococcus sp.]|nr:sigma factor-like helix-turn-helix DNA-binding protein [Oscillospiraceae bacterium]